MDLGYLNARIRAWKSRLLTREEYEGLLVAGDIKDFLNRLRETFYARDVEIAAARHIQEHEITENALKGSLANTVRQLWQYTPDEAKNFLRAVFAVWEAYNIKAVLRARDKGISSDESISVLLPVGELDEAALKELNRQSDIIDVVNLLVTWGSPYAKPLQERIHEYRQERHLITLELALDRFVYSYSLSFAGGYADDHLQKQYAGDVNREILLKCMQQRIDAMNMAMLLKMFGETTPPVNILDYFLEGGERIDRREFIRLAKSRDKKEFMERVSVLGDSRWEKNIAAIEPEDAFFLEEQLEELSRQAMCRFAIREPLSIALAVCFLYTKVREIKNVRLIARAKVFNIPSVEVKRFIIV